MTGPRAGFRTATVGVRLALGAALLAGSMAWVAAAIVRPAGTAAISGCLTGYYCGNLLLAIDGNGPGTATTTDGIINCQFDGANLSGTCDSDYTWKQSLGSTYPVFYQLTPGSGTYLCPNTLNDCGYGNGDDGYRGEVDIQPGNFSTVVHLSFWRKPVALTIGRQGSGTGTVHATSSGNDDTCSTASCTDLSVPYGVSETVTATPDPGSIFDGWTGACAGQPATCHFVITGDASAVARFDLPGSTPKPTTKPLPSRPPAGSSGQPSAGETGGRPGASPEPPLSIGDASPTLATSDASGPAASSSGPPFLAIGLVIAAIVMVGLALGVLRSGRRT